MPVKRHFLNWDASVIEKVRDFLLPQELSGPVELARDLVVMPTRQAGRRLREALARQCSSQKTALLSFRAVTPDYFLHPEDSSGTIAKPLEVAAVWAEILMNADLGLYGSLFPSYIPSQDFLWALRTGEIIQKLRNTLADGGYSIAAVYNDFRDILEEMERWQDLAELESLYLARLGEMGRRDPCKEMLGQVKSPELPGGVECIVIAAVPRPDTADGREAGTAFRQEYIHHRFNPCARVPVRLLR